MLKDLHIAHITGSATVHHNGLFSDEVSFNKPRRKIGQMFFQPYESKEEFIFCARNTLQPLLLIGLALCDPIGVSAVPGLFVAASLGCLVVGGLHKCLGNESSASWWIDAADEVMSRFCQMMINLVVLPLAAAVLLTRSISTGLKAADIYDYDAPAEPMSHHHAMCM